MIRGPFHSVESVRLGGRSRKSMEGLVKNEKAGVYRKWAADYLQKHPMVEKKTEETAEKEQWRRLLNPGNSLWHITFSEQKHDLPADWCAKKVDRKGWCVTTLPAAWPNEHWAVLRATFYTPISRSSGGSSARNLYKKLRFSVKGKWCDNAIVYLNGAEIIRCENLGVFHAPIVLNDRSMKLLEPGENQLVILSYSGTRWSGLNIDDFDVLLEEKWSEKSADK